MPYAFLASFKAKKASTMLGIQLKATVGSTFSIWIGQSKCKPSDSYGVR